MLRPRRGLALLRHTCIAKNALITRVTIAPKSVNKVITGSIDAWRAIAFINLCDASAVVSTDSEDLLLCECHIREHNSMRLPVSQKSPVNPEEHVHVKELTMLLQVPPF